MFGKNKRKFAELERRVDVLEDKVKELSVMTDKMSADVDELYRLYKEGVTRAKPVTIYKRRKSNGKESPKTSE
jgi:hypothetical protein